MISENPFRLTRAADLSDQQIEALWVDLSENQLRAKLRPASQLPMFVLGGKGSGKTHLLRFHSYEIQGLRSLESRNEATLSRTAYLGVYLRCSGLNSSRFAGKGVDAETWNHLFAYYVELWIGQALLTTIASAARDLRISASIDDRLAPRLFHLFDKAPSQAENTTTLLSLTQLLGDLQRQLDFSVNNAALRRTVETVIFCTRGAFIFGIPKLLSQEVPEFNNVTFTVILDEYENLSSDAQRYINTLVREKQSPVTFKIGARSYGLKTLSTFSGDEDLKEGSEYEIFRIDSDLRKAGSAYEDFASRLCTNRMLLQAGRASQQPMGLLPDEEWLRSCFEERTDSAGNDLELASTLERLGDRPRPWIVNLEKKLNDAFSSKRRSYGPPPSDIAEICRLLRQPDILAERTSVFLFMRDWADGGNLLESARAIRNDCEVFLNTSDRGTRHAVALDKFAEDIRAQVLRESNGKPGYFGLKAFLAMSHGIPRNLLVILKHIYDWATYLGEEPFASNAISQEAQRRGVADAANWFIRDAQILGQEGVLVQRGVMRLAELFRAIRFSDKPSECSLCTFTASPDSLPDRCRTLLQTAEQWSLLIAATDRSERNSGSPVAKYQLNGLIATHFWLPIHTRGNIHLAPDELMAIFVEESRDGFQMVLSDRVGKMTAPFGHKKEKSNEPELF